MTAQFALWAFVQSYGSEYLNVIAWDMVVPPQCYEELADRTIWLLKASKPVCHNTALRTYQEHTGSFPDIWFTMDDDFILGIGCLLALEAVLNEDTNIGLASVWNCGSQKNKGHLKMVAGEQVQFGDGFTVGGAIHAIPRRTLERVGLYDESRPRHEDSKMTLDVRSSGMDAVIIRSRYAVEIPWDGEDPGYRQWLLDMNEESKPT